MFNLNAKPISIIMLNNPKIYRKLLCYKQIKYSGKLCGILNPRLTISNSFKIITMQLFYIIDIIKRYISTFSTILRSYEKY